MRNWDVIISKPQKNVNENKASTSEPKEDQEQIQFNPRMGKGKNIVVNKSKTIKEKLPDKHVVNKEQNKDKIPPQEPPEKILENRKEIVPAETTIRPFSFELDVAKMKLSLPFNEIYRNSKYREQLIKMLKSNVVSEISNSINLEDDSPTILLVLGWSPMMRMKSHLFMLH